MQGLSVEELIKKYEEKDCYLKLKGNTWCLCKDGKVINRITSRKKVEKLLEYVYRN